MSVPPVLSTVDPCPVTIPYVPEVAVFPPDTVTEPVFVIFPVSEVISPIEPSEVADILPLFSPSPVP